MARINLHYTRVPADEVKYGKGYTLNSLTKDEFDSFNDSILGLGDISARGTYIQALAAFFDLEGFTLFANQVDSHLVIPEFLKRYLDWLCKTIADRFKEGETGNRVTVWGSLPFFAKFLGDGILFIWDTDYSGGDSGIRNIVKFLFNITEHYSNNFIPEIRRHVSNPPPRLRCGIARGQVVSIGNGEDYVGSCLNIASRLQKLGELSFAVSRRGFDLSKINSKFWDRFVLKQVELRGIGSNELVYVVKSEFDVLPARERKQFKEP